MVVILNQADCLDGLSLIQEGEIDLAIIDPPYNVWYKYNDYIDNMNHEEYIKRQIEVIQDIWRKLRYGGSCIYITYPELAAEIYTYFKYNSISIVPVEWCTRVYNTNLGGKYLRKASRGIIRFSKWEPNKKDVKWEYKNPNDRRIKKCIAEWRKPKEMDWIYVDQVKNVSKKHSHPCEIPQALLEKFVLWLTEEWDMLLDCFAWSWSLWVCAQKHNRDCILIEKDDKYCQEIKDRLQLTTYNLVPSPIQWKHDISD